MTLIGGFLSALNIVSEKEKGTIEQINVTPVPKTIFLLGKLIPFWIIGLFGSVYRTRTFHLIRFLYAATGDVYGVFLLDYLYLDERAFHTRQQYAGMGTATDAPESAPLLRRSDAYGLSERQHIGRPFRPFPDRLPVCVVLQCAGDF